MAIAFVAFTMTANAATKKEEKRVKASTAKVEVRNDDRNNRHYESDWNTCQHKHIDRYNKKYYCHTCGVQLTLKGKKDDKYYKVVTPTAKNNKNYGGRSNSNSGNKKNYSSKSNRR